MQPPTRRRQRSHTSQSIVPRAIAGLSRELDPGDGAADGAHRQPRHAGVGVRPVERALGDVGDAMARLAADPTDQHAAEVLWHQPAEVGVTRTTCIATMLRGGHAENALPQSATATVNCRIFPGVSVEEVRGVIQEVVANPALEIRTLGHPVASPASPVRQDVLEALAAGVARIRPGTPVVPYQAPYGTDGIHYRRAGIPTYGVMGLFMKDSDRFEHGLNERVPVRGFFDALEFWPVVPRRLAGRPSTS